MKGSVRTERTVSFQGGLNVAEEVRGGGIRVRLPIHGGVGAVSTAFLFPSNSKIPLNNTSNSNSIHPFALLLLGFLMGFLFVYLITWAYYTEANLVLCKALWLSLGFGLDVNYRIWAFAYWFSK